jgi:hypothetical protein
MKSSSLTLATLVACVTTLAHAQATPFGLREGMSLTDLAAVAGPLSPQEGTPPTFYVTRVPRPHPDLTVYAVVVGDSTGLCQVVGGKAIDSSSVAEIEANRVYQTLKEQLTAKYGVASSTGKVQARWLSISDAAIPGNLDAISLSLVPQPSGAILVQLRYRFMNVHRCQVPAPPPDPIRDAL